MVAIFYKNEKYTYYYVFLDQQKLESIIWFGNVAKRLRSFSFSTPPFSNAGPGPETKILNCSTYFLKLESSTEFQILNCSTDFRLLDCSTDFQILNCSTDFWIFKSIFFIFGPTIRFGQILQIKAKITITVGIVWVWNHFSIFIALICCSLVCLFNYVRSPLSFQSCQAPYISADVILLT